MPKRTIDDSYVYNHFANMRTSDDDDLIALALAEYAAARRRKHVRTFRWRREKCEALAAAALRASKFVDELLSGQCQTKSA